MTKKTTGADEKKGDANGCYYNDISPIYRRGVQDGKYQVYSKINNKIEELEKNHSPEDDYACSQIYILKQLFNENIDKHIPRID